MASKSYQLVMKTGPNPGKVFQLNKNEICFGRDISNDIVISDTEVSRKHARLVLTAGNYVLEDLGSTNGTFANGQRLMGPHVLRSGELIMFGENVSLSYEATADEAATQIGGTGVQTAYAPPPSRPQPPPRPAPQPVYTSHIPSAPPEPFYPEPELKKGDKTWLWVGCGCLVVLSCAIIGGVLAFDYMNLYCTPPFNVFFTCP